MSAGGGLAGLFGAPEVRGEGGVQTQTTVASGASTRTASEQFAQLATTASQSVDAERSLVVSRFEEAEHQTTTERTLRNDNHCYAVTYYVRRVNEVYTAHTRVVAVEWRLADGPFRSFDDVEDVPEALRAALGALRKRLPKVGDEEKDERHIAALQLETVRRCVLLWSNKGDLVAPEAASVEREFARIGQLVKVGFQRRELTRAPAPALSELFAMLGVKAGSR